MISVLLMLFGFILESNMHKNTRARKLSISWITKLDKNYTEEFIKK